MCGASGAAGLPGLAGVAAAFVLASVPLIHCVRL